MVSERLRLADLTGATEFELLPDASARRALAERLELLSLKKLRLIGTLSPEGRRDWRLDAMLGATVVQPCAVTLSPVTTRIDEPVVIRYLAEMAPLPEGDEIEMPADETAEPLPDEIDLWQVMSEALALALPAWPRLDGVDPVDIRVSAGGSEQFPDDDTKPFSALKTLKDQLRGDGSGGG